MERLINTFPHLRYEAESIELSEDYAKAEIKFAISFYNLKPASRASLQEGVPIIVLHRLMNIIHLMRYEKSQKLGSERRIVKKDSSSGNVDDLNFKSKYYEND